MLSKEQLEEFFRKLEGPEGCDFKEDAKGKITWNCKAGMDKTHAKRILKNMGIPKWQADEFLDLCDEHGGHCDCEILMNAEERIMHEYAK
jgi:hypothetical protein